MPMNMEWIGSGRWLLALAALCLGFGAVVTVELTTRTNFEPPGAAGPLPVPAAPPTATEFAPPPLAQYAEMVLRPLFSESRRPPEPAGDSSAPPKLFEGILIGVLIGQGEPVALLKIASESEVTRVTKGQTIRGWLVTGIHPDRVVLQGERMTEIRLRDDAAEGDRPSGAGAPPLSLQEWQSRQRRAQPQSPPPVPPRR